MIILKKDQIIEALPWFSRDYYLNQTPELGDVSVEDALNDYMEKGWRRFFDPSEHFSTRYYLDNNPDVVESGQNPLLHYVVMGRHENRSSGRSTTPINFEKSPLRTAYEIESIKPEIDEEFYYRQVPRIREIGISPAQHYIDQGWRELRDPSPSFSTAGYLEDHIDVRIANFNPLLHYVESGRPENRLVRPSTVEQAPDPQDIIDIPLLREIESGRPENRQVHPSAVEQAPDPQVITDIPPVRDVGSEHPESRQIRPPADEHILDTLAVIDIRSVSAGNTEFAEVVFQTLNNVLMFNLPYFKATNEVSGHDVAIIANYIQDPMRSASPYFDPIWYLSQNPEAGPPGWNVHFHYLSTGRIAGLRPSEWFDGNEIAISEDVVKSIVSQSGLFQSDWYKHANQDVARANADPLRHYSRVGHAEYKRMPNPLFDNTFYIKQAPDIRDFKWHPLVHYVVVGSKVGLSTHPIFDVEWFEKADIKGDKAQSPLKRLLDQDAINSHLGPNPFFDPKFYLDRCPEAATHPGGAVAHFLEIGWKRRLDPSDRFSTAAYITGNLDVSEKGMNPFLHFILNGRLEGRNPKPRAQSIPTQLTRFGDPEYGAFGPNLRYDSDVTISSRFALSVAVHLHLYYTEMTEEFCHYLSYIPVPFQLFVSVPPGRGDVAAVEAAFRAKLRNCRQVIVESPLNRGRDVAPFLVHFGQRLLAFDLVLHLHSKRSPHSPKHADWRRYLLHYVLGNNSIVSQILMAFQLDHDLGVFQPPYHPRVRAQPKWGGNRDLIADLLARFGLSYVGENCPDFPAGSYFWARTDALRPLLEGRLAVEDFDEESGQIDGTLAHALERLFGIVPVTRGYSVVSRYIDVAHNLITYYGKDRSFPDFANDRNHDIIAYQQAVQARGGRRGRVAVVTTISGPFDALLLPYKLEAEIDYYCVTDSVTDGYGVFRLLPLPYVDADPRRSARYVKTNLLRLFQGYEFVVWVDANVLVRTSIIGFVESTKASGHPVGGIPHPIRATYLEEAETAVRSKLDEADLIDTQIKTYMKVERLADATLIETNFMIFDARQPVTNRFLRVWWNELNRHSRRDQLSVNYALLKTGVAWHPLLPEFQSTRDNASFSLFRHGLNEWGPKPHIYTAWNTPNIHDGYLLPLVDLQSWTRKAGVLDLDVVICVHNALEDVRDCLKSVVKALNGRGSIIIVDDASGSKTADFLNAYAPTIGAVLVRHDTRLGYTKAANSGVRIGKSRHVLLLNSDTVVPANALDKLCDALDRDPLLGIVGPLSNAASFQSVPSTMGTSSQTAINPIPIGMTIADMDLFLERRWDGRVVKTPLVHGFCFCVKRALFDEMGTFDEESFPSGYGEENDFCFRTMDAGYDLGVLTNTYVFHAKSKSYAPQERAKLMDEGMSALVSKHGKARISRSVATMSKQPALQAVQRAVLALFDRPELKDRQRGRLFLLPTLRSDGLPAGSGYVRVLLPYRCESVTDDWEVLELRSPNLPSLTPVDAVLVQRDASLIPTASLTSWIDAIKSSGARLIYEIDDDLLDGHALTKRGFKGDTEELASRVLTLAKAADCVTVSSTALELKLRGLNDHVVFVPNAIDSSLWQLDREPSSLRRLINSTANNRVIIGYVGTPTHGDDLALTQKALANLSEAYPQRIDLQIVGGFGSGQQTFGRIVALPIANDYPSFVRWLKQNICWDIAVVPLVGNAFNNNKSYLKFLECAALGAAVACSQGPEYAKVARDGVNGLLVPNTLKDWTSALRALINEPNRRLEMARQAFEDVRDRHSLDQLAPLLLRVLRPVA